MAGNVKVGNRRSLLGRWQHIEYVIGFNLDRRLYETLGCMPTVPGAIAAFRRLARVRPLDRLVTALNSRALTIYLWHNAAIAVCFVVGDLIDVWRIGQVGYLPVALVLLTVVVLLLGWIEDVSARRRPRLVPWRASVPTTRGPVRGVPATDTPTRDQVFVRT